MKITAIGDNRGAMKYLGRGDDGEFYATLDGGATWQKVSKPGADGAKGDKGFSGITFFPAIDADGWLTWTNDGGARNPAPIKLALASGQGGMKVFANATDTLSGFNRAAAYALENGIPGECVSAQHLDGTWGVYQIQNNRTIKLINWFGAAEAFTSDDVDESGYAHLTAKSFPHALRSISGKVIAISPGDYDAENGLYHLNLSGIDLGNDTWEIVY